MTTTTPLTPDIQPPPTPAQPTTPIPPAVRPTPPTTLPLSTPTLTPDDTDEPSREPNAGKAFDPFDVAEDESAILSRGDVETRAQLVRKRARVKSLDGGIVLLESISAAAKEAIEGEALSWDSDGNRKIDTKKMKLSTVQCGWIDPVTGDRMYVGKAGREALGQLRADVVDEVFLLIQKLSGQKETSSAELRGN